MPGCVAGGLRQGVDYAHQIGLQFDVDWETLADIPGFSTHMVVVNRAGRNLRSDYIGDNVLQAQEIFGAGFDMAVHDVWFYGEERLFDGRVDAVFGRISGKRQPEEGIDEPGNLQNGFAL